MVFQCVYERGTRYLKDLLEVPGGVGGLEVQISKGCGGEKSNIFPEGPRALPERNLPISHLRFDKSRKR